MSSATCIACQVVFSTHEGQREHYKSDWHRYNLKRKVAELPPVNADNFRERVLAQKAQTERSPATSSRNCTFCRKRFSSVNAFANHLASKKHLDSVKSHDTKAGGIVHRENLKNLLDRTKGKGPSLDPALDLEDSEETDGEFEEVDSDEWEDAREPLKPEDCLFCPTVNASLEENLKHMTLAHSLFVPDAEYCVDIEGLFEYLGGKVGYDHVCLWCDDKGKSFPSTRAVQQHMVDKGHCRILHEGEALLQYADFYDYASSYPEGENPDEEVEDAVIESDGYELVLPSGAIIGHRSLFRYYRQNLPPLRDRPQNKYLLNGVLHQYRALGWTGTTGAAAVRNAKDLRYMRHVRSKHSMQVGVKANKLQRHFRQQNPM